MGDIMPRSSTNEPVAVREPVFNGRNITIPDDNTPKSDHNGDLIVEQKEDVALPPLARSDATRLDLTTIKPSFHESDFPESPKVQAMIQALQLIKHIEGGYFNQTDASPITVPWPPPSPPSEEAKGTTAAAGDDNDDTTAPLSEHTVGLTGGLRPGLDPARRRLSTTIFYLLTPRRPLGSFHRNRNRIIHTLHRGRGRYVLIHPAGRVESFVVGQDVARGERLQWVVEGGVWKASFLLPVDGASSSSSSSSSSAGEDEGLLISETVVPGFEYIDHEFLSLARFKELLWADEAKELDWLVREEEKEVEASNST